MLTFNLQCGIQKPMDIFMVALSFFYLQCTLNAQFLTFFPLLDLNDAKEREHPSYGHFRLTVLVVCAEPHQPAIQTYYL